MGDVFSITVLGPRPRSWTRGFHSRIFSDTSFFLLQSATVLCLAQGCGGRVSTDGHRHCSLHATCWSKEGFDPEVYEVCSPCVHDLHCAPKELHHSPESLALLKKAWTRARKMLGKRGMSVTWSNSDLGTSQYLETEIPLLR